MCIVSSTSMKSLNSATFSVASVELDTSLISFFLPLIVRLLGPLVGVVLSLAMTEDDKQSKNISKSFCSAGLIIRYSES